jgi:fluoroacetyl-CoA thioesterase
MALEPGLLKETEITVQEGDTARASGGETLPPVLSTPRLISYLEQTAHAAVLPYLGEGQSTVGVVVNIRHLAATPVGMKACFRAELLEIDGRRLRFRVEAWDELEKIAEGEHERFTIDRVRFLERLQKKSQQVK